MPETLDHLALKRLAIAWLWRLGCRVVATEVQCPIGRYRIDVAGWFDRPVDGLLERAAAESASLWAMSDGARRARTRGPEAWRTIIVECKQSRADFARDHDQPESLLAERERLEAKRRAMEETKVKRFEPELRREGSSLFSALDEWDYGKSKLSSYRAVLRELQRVDDALYGQTKFARFARYRLADRLVIFAPAGMIRPRELPTDWGLVECHRRPLRRGKAEMANGVDPLADLPLRETVAPRALGCHPTRRERLFRTIAIAASREAVRRIAPEALRAPAAAVEAARDDGDAASIDSPGVEATSRSDLDPDRGE
ncbi:MAG: hypothetical protein U0572_18660 [Phycisphaerales bacterium]